MLGCRKERTSTCFIQFQHQNAGLPKRKNFVHTPKKKKDVKKEVRSHTKKEKDARLSQLKWKKVLVSHTKTQREIKY